MGKANHAHKGLYAKAFFDLSVGLERLGKLIFVSDWAMSNSGSFPDDNDLRRLGHDLLSIKREVDGIADKRSISSDIAKKPTDPVHNEIWTSLSEFGKMSRYYNLDFVSGGKGASNAIEPMARWWNCVVKLILERHYTKKTREKDERQAKFMNGLLGQYTSVIHFDENQRLIDNIEDAARLSGATNVAQKYGRLYVLQIVRWLSHVLSELSHEGAYNMRIVPLLGLNEPFAIFFNDDAYLRARRTWSIY